MHAMSIKCNGKSSIVQHIKCPWSPYIKIKIDYKYVRLSWNSIWKYFQLIGFLLFVCMTTVTNIFVGRKFPIIKHLKWKDNFHLNCLHTAVNLFQRKSPWCRHAINTITDRKPPTLKLHNNPNKMTKCKWILNESDIVTDCLQPLCIQAHAIKIFHLESLNYLSIIAILCLSAENETMMIAHWRLCKWFFGIHFSISFSIIHALDFIFNHSLLCDFVWRSNINYEYKIALLIYWWRLNVLLWPYNVVLCCVAFCV